MQKTIGVHTLVNSMRPGHLNPLIPAMKLTRSNTAELGSRPAARSQIYLQISLGSVTGKRTL